MSVSENFQASQVHTQLKNKVEDPAHPSGNRQDARRSRSGKHASSMSWFDFNCRALYAHFFALHPPDMNFGNRTDSAHPNQLAVLLY